MPLGRRSDVPWDKVRRHFMITGSVRGTALHFGISRTALYKRIMSDGWREERARIVKRAEQRDNGAIEKTVAQRMREHADFAGQLVEDLKIARAVVLQHTDRPTAMAQSLLTIADALQRSSKLHLELSSRLGENLDVAEPESDLTIYTAVVKLPDGRIVEIGPSEGDSEAQGPDTSQTA